MKGLAILLCTCAGFFANGHTILSFQHSDGDHSCSGQGVTSTALSGTELLMQFVLEENCRASFYARVAGSSEKALFRHEVYYSSYLLNMRLRANRAMDTIRFSN